MTDDRLDALLARLERPVLPDDSFADRLFDELVDEAGLRRGTGGVRARLRGLGVADSPPVFRLAWIAIIAALLVVLAALLGGVGSRPNPFAVASPVATSPLPSSQRASASPPTRIASGVMEIGTKAPTWSGTQLDGTTFSTDDLAGRPAALFIWCSCIRGSEARLFLEAAAARTDEIAMVFVSADTEGTTRGLADWLNVTTPVVLDPAMGLVDSWKLDGFPALVLLRPDGRLADIQAATFDGPQLARVLDALAANAPIPDPLPAPPPPLDEQGRLRLTTVLAVGAVAPTLTGPRLGGGELSTSDLRGRPAAVQFWLPPRADGSPQDDTAPADALIADVERRGEAIDLVLVAEGEPEPGDARRYLERQGSAATVVFDWAGELYDRWGLVIYQTLVLLDADGRVAGLYGPEALANPGPRLDTIARSSGSGGPPAAASPAQ